MARPVGVTILAILDFLGALLCVIFGILALVGGGMMATVLSQAGGQGSGAGAGMLAGLGAAFGVIILVFAALYILIGWGMWKLKNWARIVTIVFMALGIAGSLFGLVGLLAHFTVFGLIWTIFWLAIYALIIWYLLKPEVKAAFQS